MAAAALRFEASMVLSGALDALGYRAGAWEFCKSTATVRAECAALAGRPSPLPLTLAPPLFPLSDDTVMHLRTAQAINVADVHEMPSRLRERYVTCLDEQCLMGRAFGPTTISALRALKASPLSVLSVPFSGTGGGCGGAMRAMCIGLRFAHEQQLRELCHVAIASARLTHNHPTGYLGALVSAFFTALAIQAVPPIEWGERLLVVALPEAERYVASTVTGNGDGDGSETAAVHLREFEYFTRSWRAYLALRHLPPTAPPSLAVSNLVPGALGGFFDPLEDTDAAKYDEFVNRFSWSGWGGASGHDAPMIAYDALLWSGSDWEQLCLRAALHGGDSDSTGAIAGAWRGALFGFHGVPPRFYQQLECLHELQLSGKQLYQRHTAPS